MKSITQFILISVIFMASGCASNLGPSAGEFPDGPILLITDDRMNAHASSNYILNSKMREEVAIFTDKLKSNIESGGRKAFYRDMPADTNAEQIILITAQTSPEHYSYLGQIYWSADSDNNIYISVSFLPIIYKKSGIVFGKDKGTKYFVLGPGKYSEMSAPDMADSFYASLIPSVFSGHKE